MKVPGYCDQSITEEVTVDVMVSSGGRTSEPHPLTYLPPPPPPPQSALLTKRGKLWGTSSQTPGLPSSPPYNPPSLTKSSFLPVVSGEGIGIGYLTCLLLVSTRWNLESLYMFEFVLQSWHWSKLFICPPHSFFLSLFLYLSPLLLSFVFLPLIPYWKLVMNFLYKSFLFTLLKSTYFEKQCYKYLS